MTTEKITETTGCFQGQQITGIKAFAAAIKPMLEKLHPSARIDVHEVRKNNNLVLTGIVIRDKESNIAPTIYLEDFFWHYQNGKSLTEICWMIEEFHQKASPGRNFDVNSIAEFSAVKEKIFYKLVNAEKNAALLQSVPHRSWQDLAVIYYISVPSEDAYSVSSIMVNNEILALWDVSEHVLYENAHRNTPELFNAKIMCMTEVIKNMFQEMAGPEAEMFGGMLAASADIPQLYVATNDSHINGAAVILYDGILEKFARQINSDFYIFPSSIHETLFLPVPPDADEHKMPEMVRSVNLGCVAPEEVLSDNAYRYYAKNNSVQLVS